MKIIHNKNNSSVTSLSGSERTERRERSDKYSVVMVGCGGVGTQVLVV